MSRRPSSLRPTWVMAFGLLLATLGSARADEALARFPSLHGDSVVFEAHGNLWEVSRNGGKAMRLTAEPGYDVMPRFSPDGKWIAFTGQYQANTDVYVIPAQGGPAKRLTYHSDVVDQAPERWGPDNMVLGWTPDSKEVVFLSRRSSMNSWFGRYFTVPVTGGEEKLMSLDKGGMFSWSPDGETIAYNRIFRNFRTWKRYTGGLHQNVWTYNFKTGDSRQLTDWKGSDIDPMWYGHIIYFASDRGADHHMNIWAYDTQTKNTRQVTHFADYDVDWPSLGDNGIVMQDGGALYVLDLPSEQLHKLAVDIPDDGVETGPRYVDGSHYMQLADPAGFPSFDIAPNGKRALLQARGDVFTLPAAHGNTRNLTQSSDAKEESPTWSPDGKWVAYVTDASGEDQVAIRPSEGGDEQVLSSFKEGYFYRPMWSADSSKLAFSDNLHQLWYLDVKSRRTTRVDQDVRNEIHDYAWSPDGKWLAYSKNRDNQIPGIWLYSLESGKATLLSSPFDADVNPAFDPDGKYLYFLSARHENPTFSQSEFNIATLKMFGVYAATLDRDAASPFAPKSDEGIPSKEDKGDKDKNKTLHIDLEGLMARAVPLPVPADNYAELTATAGHVYYLTLPNQTIEGPLPGERGALHQFDMEKRKDRTLIADVVAYELSADGKTALVQTPENKLGFMGTDGNDDKPSILDTSHMQMRIDPRQEWAEMFHMAWRLERDFFVNPKMNGVDWNGVQARYAKLLPLVGHRQDLNYLIGEMQGELSNSHTYVGGGDTDDDRQLVATALVGADYGLDAKSGRYFFKKIYAGDNTRKDYLSPLTEPGIDVHEGDFLLAVDGRELKAPTDPYSLFVGARGHTVTLTVADNADGRGKHDVTVQTLHDELAIRQDDWIRHNRETVAKASGGQIGYIYLDDMGANGMKQFIDQFYPQIDKQGLIIDDRFNGGGFIDQIVLERLRRVLTGMNTNREGVPETDPPVLSNSYKVCLINEYSASDGDIFPYYFRKYGLGPLIGMRTWGGVRGIRGEWPLLDNGYITVPEGTQYGLDSQWTIENHGVDPDMQVDDLPGDVVNGKDAQLDAAVKYLMDKIKTHPLNLPSVPAMLPGYPPEGHE